ncbi:hypothetical protein FACS1894158_00530 [Betaproteobacteria bacterium]|nr:hypothetical protein FACS1894158_00530 [Betaproteobacteria bacterium]
MEDIVNLKLLLNSLLYSVLGVLVFWISFLILDKLTPQELWKEIVEQKNQPLATVIAAMCLGVAIIIAAAIHG